MRCQTTVKFGLLFGTRMQVYIVRQCVPDRMNDTQPIVNRKVGQVRDSLINVHLQSSNRIVTSDADEVDSLADRVRRPEQSRRSERTSHRGLKGHRDRLLA